MKIHVNFFFNLSKHWRSPFSIIIQIVLNTGANESDVHRYVQSWANGSELGVRQGTSFKAGSTPNYMTLSNSVLPFTTESPARFVRHKLLLPNPRVSNLIGQDVAPKICIFYQISRYY